jgi:hypothetical protein
MRAAAGSYELVLGCLESEGDTYGSVRLRLESTILKPGALSFSAGRSWELSYWRYGFADSGSRAFLEIFEAVR